MLLVSRVVVPRCPTHPATLGGHQPYLDRLTTTQGNRSRRPSPRAVAVPQPASAISAPRAISCTQATPSIRDRAGVSSDARPHRRTAAAWDPLRILRHHRLPTRLPTPPAADWYKGNAYATSPARRPWSHGRRIVDPTTSHEPSPSTETRHTPTRNTNDMQPPSTTRSNRQPSS